MARETIKKGLTSVIREFVLRDATGQPKTGIAYGSVTIKYTRAGDSSETTITAVSGTLGTWTSGGWAEFSGTGKYQFGVPNAAVVSGVDCVSITFAASGCITKEITIQLSGVDMQDAVRQGMTALPNAAASTVGGLPLAVDTSGRVDVLKINGTNQTARGLGNALPAAAPGASGGVLIAGSNAATTISTLTISGPASVGGALSVTGLVTYGSLTITGPMAVGGAFTVAGGTTLTGGMAANITGNLTGNVSGSVGSVTGAVGSVTGNVGGNVAGSTASVTGAVGSVTGNVGGNVNGSVGSVTGNVGGNVTGSVASVTGAVGSVTGNVSGNVIGSVGGLPSAPTDWLTAAAVKADAVTKIQNGLSVLTTADLNNATPTVTLAATQTAYAPAKAGDAMTLTSAYNAAKTAAQAGDAMTLTSGERTAIAGAIWAALTSGLTTADSIGLLLKTLGVDFSNMISGSGTPTPDFTEGALTNAPTGSGASVDDIADRLLTNPDNKLLTDSSGYVTATNGSGATVDLETNATFVRTK